MIRFSRLLILSVLLASQPLLAFAQDDDTSSDAANIARLDVKISQLQEQIRQLQGTIEQTAYQNQALKAQMEKTNGDIQFRLSDLEKKNVAAVPPQAASSTAVAAEPVDTAQGDQLRPVEPAGASAATDAEVPDDGAHPAAAATKFSSARDQYNYARKLLSQAKYAEAGAVLTAFTQQHSGDPLIGNAYYWLGETYYVRRDYIHASDNFRQGYQSLPTGPKAADNLLKLAMSLDALRKDKEACVVLKQVTVKFSDNVSSVKSRAEQEMNRIGCN